MKIEFDLKTYGTGYASHSIPIDWDLPKPNIGDVFYFDSLESLTKFGIILEIHHMKYWEGVFDDYDGSFVVCGFEHVANKDGVHLVAWLTKYEDFKEKFPNFNHAFDE